MASRILSVLALLAGSCAAAFAGDAPFRPDDWSALRKTLRAFYPDECHGICKDPRQQASVKAIGDGLDAWAAAHPGYDALDLRRESYLLMRKHVRPFLFEGMPFYFELGVNGGWCTWTSEVVVPGRHVNRLTRGFYESKGLVPKENWNLLNDRKVERLINCCGPFVDDQHHLPPFRTVFRKGFKGVKEDVEAALAACPPEDRLGRKELETALVGLDTIHAIQLAFHEEAKRKLAELGVPPGGRPLPDSNNPTFKQSNILRRIAEAAARCPWEPPQTFYEGLNTLGFLREALGYADGICLFALGRPDAWLIDLYRADLAAGRITRDEARRLVAAFLVTFDCHLDTDLTIDAYADQEAEIALTLGGCDAHGEPVYNELTEMILDAHIGCDCVFPKLHCRIAATSPRPYLRKIGEMLMADHAVFALFNDDTTVKTVAATGVPLELARDYVGCGCWDPYVDSVMDADAGNYTSPMRVFELTVHRDPEVERKARIQIDPIDGAQSFEEVRDTVYRNYIRFFRDVISEYNRYGRANAQVFPHPVYTMCIEGGVASRRDVTDGGVRFKPRITTLAFLANVVDSLCAIRKLCYEDRVCTLAELLAAVRANWQGAEGERLRRLVLTAPYWGDNSAASNGLMKWWIDSVAADIEGVRNDRGGPYLLACWIYREFLLWGEQMKATPDGRRNGDRLSQGFAPSDYRCEAEAASVLNALGSLDHTRLYASNANLSFDKLSMNAAAFEAVFRVACRSGMHLLQPNCVSVEELLDAQAHPERHRNLIVKVCGFSARFSTLSKRWQDEVIARHKLR